MFRLPCQEIKWPLPRHAENPTILNSRICQRRPNTSTEQTAPIRCSWEHTRRSFYANANSIQMIGIKSKRINPLICIVRCDCWGPLGGLMSSLNKIFKKWKNAAVKLVWNIFVKVMSNYCGMWDLQWLKTHHQIPGYDGLIFWSRQQVHWQGCLQTKRSKALCRPVRCTRKW